MDVSKNSGTPKSSILIGISITNHPFWGTFIFGRPIYFRCRACCQAYAQNIPWWFFHVPSPKNKNCCDCFFLPPDLHDDLLLKSGGNQKKGCGKDMDQLKVWVPLERVLLDQIFSQGSVDLKAGYPESLGITTFVAIYWSIPSNSGIFKGFKKRFFPEKYMNPEWWLAGHLRVDQPTKRRTPEVDDAELSPAVATKAWHWSDHRDGMRRLC